MKVFLSWSGELSHRIALVFREWLPSVIQSLKPYVSSQDIDKGARWSTDIAKELSESTYGILCITKENIDAPWINFEAGALSKTIDKSYVSPFLLGIKRSEVQGPLLQFQSTVNQKADVLKLLESINARAIATEQLEPSALKKAFDVWWGQFEDEMKKIEVASPEPHPKPAAGKHEAILEEILELTRTQQKLLRSPEQLLPPDYLDFALSKTRTLTKNSNADKLHMAIAETRRWILKLSKEDLIKEEILEKLNRIHTLYHRTVETRRARELRAKTEPEILKPTE